MSGKSRKSSAGSKLHQHGRHSQPIALVTGSGRRLGRRIAVALASAGYDVVIHYRESTAGAKETARLVREQGRESLICRADIRRSRDVARMFERLMRKFGRLDLLVNNAAILPRPTAVADLAESDWRNILDTNLTGSFFCAQQAAKIMLRQESGQIINLASIGALQSWKMFLSYNVSKAGIVMMTRAMARALAPYVTVNAIAPGTIIIPGEETGRTHQPPVDRIALKKYGKPDDVVHAVLFLALQADYVTGQVLAVDGGLSIP